MTSIWNNPTVSLTYHQGQIMTKIVWENGISTPISLSMALHLLGNQQIPADELADLLGMPLLGMP